jgi:hypothetical protein
VIDMVLYTSNMSVYARARLMAKAPELMASLMRTRGLPGTQGRVNLVLNAAAPPVVWQFEFATPKSQAFYFANFADDLPYQRTDKVRQWKVNVTDVDETGFTVRLENASEYAQWVYGSRQVPGHGTTGWPFYPEVMEREGLRSVAWIEVGGIWRRVTRGAGQVRFEDSFNPIGSF